MTTDSGATPDGRTRGYWIGWVLSCLAIAFLVMDATMKLLALPIVLESSAPLGFAGTDMRVGTPCLLKRLPIQNSAIFDRSQVAPDAAALIDDLELHVPDTDEAIKCRA